MAREKVEQIRRIMDEWATRYWHSTYAYALSLAKDPQTAEDLTQTAFERTQTYMHDPNAKSILDPQPWLNKIVKNEYLNQQRKSSKQTSDSLESKHFYMSTDSEGLIFEIPDKNGYEPEHAYEAEEHNQEIKDKIASILAKNPSMSNATTLYILDDLNCREIAERSGIPYSTIKHYINTGIRQLKLKIQSGSNTHLERSEL